MYVTHSQCVHSATIAPLDAHSLNLHKHACFCTHTHTPLSIPGTLLATPVLTWEQAEQFCVAAGGHLASIHSAAEDEEVRLFMLAETTSDYPWIGGYSAPENTPSTYQWSDGTPWDYANPIWYHTDDPHPNNVHYYRNGDWGVHTPSSTQNGVCRILGGNMILFQSVRDVRVVHMCLLFRFFLLTHSLTQTHVWVLHDGMIIFLAANYICMILIRK